MKTLNLESWLAANKLADEDKVEKDLTGWTKLDDYLKDNSSVRFSTIRKMLGEHQLLSCYFSVTYDDIVNYSMAITARVEGDEHIVYLDNESIIQGYNLLSNCIAATRYQKKRDDAVKGVNSKYMPVYYTVHNIPVNQS